MAAPTVTWYPVTGSSPTKGSSISVVDFGNVQAGYWSAVKCVLATFTGNSANTLKFWLNDWSSTGGNTNVSYYNQETNKWDHMLRIDTSYVNPADAGMTDAVKAGTDPVPTIGGNFARTPEAEPGSTNFEDSTVDSGGDTDYIYMCLRPPANAGDGVTENWGFRLSFLYP